MEKDKKFLSLNNNNKNEGYFGPKREGGISNVPKIALKCYLHHIIEARPRIKNH